MCSDIFYSLFFDPSLTLQSDNGRQIRSDFEYVGDISDDPSLCQSICALTANNSSTETMTSSSGRG